MRNLDLSHILNIKNGGVLPKSASFRGNLVKCASFRYKQWNVLPSLRRESMGRLHRKR